MKVYYKDKNSVITGDVRIKEEANIWPFAVLRGDINYIEIGIASNIQDGCIIHVTKELPAIVGDFVTVGHNAVIHGCRILNSCLIGMSAVILDNAVIEQNSLVAAGSVILEGQVVKEGSLYAGVPGKFIRLLTEEEILKIKKSSFEYIEIAKENLLKVAIL